MRFRQCSPSPRTSILVGEAVGGPSRRLSSAADVAQDPRFRRSVNPPWPGAFFFAHGRKGLSADLSFFHRSRSARAQRLPVVSRDRERRRKDGSGAIVGVCPKTTSPLPRRRRLAGTSEPMQRAGVDRMDVSISIDQALESGGFEIGARRRPWKALSQPAPQSARRSTAR